jgi:hypothetical protein
MKKYLIALIILASCRDSSKEEYNASRLDLDPDPIYKAIDSLKQTVFLKANQLAAQRDSFAELYIYYKTLFYHCNGTLKYDTAGNITIGKNELNKH